MDDTSSGDQEITLSAYLETPKFVQASTNATRLISKLKTAVQNKELYETQQILSTVYFRFNLHEEKLEPLIDLLYHGAIYLLGHGEFTSGQDVAALFLETSRKRLQSRLDSSNQNDTVKQYLLRPNIAYHRDNGTLDLDICHKTANIAIHLPDKELGRPKFIAESLKLLSPKILNRDLLHNVIANKFWQLKDYENARYHFLHSANLDNAQDVAKLLIEFHTTEGNKNERDLFITQFILQFMCIQHPLDPPPRADQQFRQQQSSIGPANSTVSRKSRNTIKLIAEKIFSTFTQAHPSLVDVKPPFPSLKLLNFTYFIISILDSTKSEASVYKSLVENYRPAWSRDPNYQIYLNRIGVLYFGLLDQAKLQQQQQGGGGFFNNILMSLLDGTDEDDENGSSLASTPDPSRDARSTFVTSCDEVD